MGRQHVRRDTPHTRYEVRPCGRDYDIIRSENSKLVDRSRRAGVLDFVIHVTVSCLHEVLKELKLKLKQCKEWFEMESDRNGRIRFQGTKKVLDLIEEFGYRADLV